MFVTVTVKVAVFPAYVTVSSCSPIVFLLYPLTIFAVISISCVLPSSYVTFIFPPANISSVNSVPFTYVVLFGSLAISIPVTLFVTVTVNFAVFPSYVTVSSCSPILFLSYPLTIFAVISIS